MGRKPIGSRAMTGAERMRLLRERLRREQAARPDAPQTASSEITLLKAEVSKLKARIGELEAKPTAAPEDQRLRWQLADAQTQLKAARTEIANLKTARAAAPSSEEARREIALLKKRLHEKQAEVKSLKGHMAAQGVMAPEAFKKIMQANHPDTRPTPEQRHEATALLNAWWDTAKRRRPR